MQIGFVAYDWGNAWIPMYRNEIETRGDEMILIEPGSNELIKADAYLHMWAVDNPHMRIDAPQVVCLRRFEMFQGLTLPWGNINHLVLCNDAFKATIDSMSPNTETHLIYNAVDLSRWNYAPRIHGYKIGMACHIHPKKNLPLAAQILAKLPEGFELHIAGAIQDPATTAYFQSIAGMMEGKRLVLYGQIPREGLDEWWEDKNYCLSTSLSEGNPNNVLEAMAKGIKPVVHAWPGAKEQFGTVFHTVDEAVKDICSGPYESQIYIEMLKTRHGLDNITRVVNLLRKEVNHGKR